MSYSGDSLIMGDGLASAAAITAWIQSQNVKAPPELGPIIVSEATAGGVNADLVAAQTVHETGYWTSYAATHLNNPAGIGITNDLPQDQWPPFPTIQAGLHAQVAHLLTYTLGTQNPWWNDDPRAPYVPQAWLGAVDSLSDLDGRWAYPGNGYGQRIAELGNELLAFAANYAAHFEGGDVDDPEAEWKPSSNYDAGRGGVVIDRIVLHTTEGAYDGALSWLRGAAAGSSNRNSSTHYLIDADGGRLAQLVLERDTAWTAGNYTWNQRSINIEQEGYAGRGGFSDGLYQAVGALVGRIAARHGIPLDREHVIGHSEVPNQDHTDPGEFYSFERVLAIAQGQSPQPEPSEPLDPARYFPETGHYLGLGFKRFWEDNGGLPIFGYPLSEEFTGPEGFTVQWFERARFEYQPALAGNPWGVVLGNIGSEALESDRAFNPEAFARRE